MSPSAVAAGGLVLDIAGAWFLAMGLVMKSPESLVEEAAGGYDYSAELECSLAVQTADAQVGAATLTAGFLVQMASALGWHESSWRATAIAVVAGVLAAGAAWVFLARHWRPRSTKRALAVRLRALSELGSWMPALLAYGRVLDCPWRGEPETQAAYGERLLGRRRWGALTGDMTLSRLMTQPRSEIYGTDEYWTAHPEEFKKLREPGADRPQT